MESRAEDLPRVNSETRLLDVAGAVSLVGVGGVQSLIFFGVNEAAALEDCPDRGGTGFVPVWRFDTAGGVHGSEVVLRGSGNSAVGDVAEFLCGIGGACIVRVSTTSSCTKRETSSSCSSRLPGKSYIESKRLAMGVTTASSCGKDVLCTSVVRIQVEDRYMPFYRVSKEPYRLGVHLQEIAKVMQAAALGGPYNGLILSQDEVTPAAVDGEAANGAVLLDDLISIDQRVEVVYGALAGR